MKHFFKITNFTTVGSLNSSNNRIQKIAPDIDYKLLKKKKSKTKSIRVHKMWYIEKKLGLNVPSTKGDLVKLIFAKTIVSCICHTFKGVNVVGELLDTVHLFTKVIGL